MIPLIFMNSNSTYLVTLFSIKLIVLIFLFFRYRKKNRKIRLLREHEWIYRNYFEQSQSPSIMIDKTNQLIINVNQQFELISGKNKKEWLNKNISVLESLFLIEYPLEPPNDTSSGYVIYQCSPIPAQQTLKSA
jgi:hypothetical protein